MPKIKQQPVPQMVLPVLKQAGIRIKNYKSVASFEKDLQKFLKRNHVLHLCTCKKNSPRCTPLEYRLSGLTFYILSEGGGKFDNLKINKKVSFGIAEPYNSDEDYFSAKGVQAWGTVKVIGIKENPNKFNAALKKMNIMKAMRKLGFKELPPNFNYRIIEITPDRIKYGNLREGVYHITWERK